MDTTTPKKTLAAVVALALALPAGALVWASAADAEDVDEVAAVSCGLDLTPEERAEFQADEDALAAHLDAASIAHTWSEPDADGLRIVEWDYDDDAANAAVDAFWAQRFPLLPEEVAELNEEADALATHLEAQGIDHAVTTDAEGVRTVAWDEDDDDANEAVDAYYAALYPLTPEDVEAINADADGLAAHLASAGVAHEVVTEDDGTRWVSWDEEDPAANAAVDEYYEASAEDDGAELVEC